MSVFENVSSFEYRVWRIRRWFFMNAVSVMVFAEGNGVTMFAIGKVTTDR